MIKRYYELIFNVSKKYFLLAIFSIISLSMLESVSVLSLAPIVDILAGKDVSQPSQITIKFNLFLNFFKIEGTVAIYSITFILLNLFKAYFSILTQKQLLNTKYKVIEAFTFNTFKAFMNSRLEFFSSSQQGLLISTFSREISKIGDSVGSFITMHSHLVKLLFYLSIPLFISWKLTIILFFSLLLLQSPSYFIKSKSLLMGKLNTSTSNQLQIILSESLNCAKLIIGYGAVQNSISHYERAFEDHRKITIPFQLLSFKVSAFYEPILLCLLFFVLYASIHIFNLSVSESIIILYALRSAIPALTGIATANTQMSGAISSFDQVEHLAELAKSYKINTGSHHFEGLKQSISFKNVSHSYGGERLTLSNVTFDIKKGESVAFVGHSGAGKTTISDLILGFINPNTGSILIDGVELQTLDVNTVRDKIGFVSQDSILFNSTIRENMLWSNPLASNEEIRLACQMANASDFIEKLELGYDSLIGDRGTKLSGGERQRICLARALVRNPQILILDEATSALDSTSEFLIQQAIEKLSKSITVILIAHRLSTIRNADQIFVIEEGKIVENGSFDELINLRNAFFKYATQQGASES